MNVVFLPALASLASVQADAFPCLSGTCLLGWAWLTAALTLLSVWAVRDWQPSGGSDKAVLGRRIVPAAGAAGTTNAAALLPRPSEVAPRARASSSSLARPPAGLALAADVVAASLGLRASPTTDMAAAVPPERTPRPGAVAGRSLPSRRPVLRSPGTPTVPEPSGSSGQHPPA